MPAASGPSPSNPRDDAPRREGPKPVGGYTETILRVIGVIFGAIGQADPAARSRGRSAPSMRCPSPEAARWLALRDVLVLRGGLGASPTGDGLSHANNPISTATMPPAEILEASNRCVTALGLATGFGGSGRTIVAGSARSMNSRRWWMPMCSCSASAARARLWHSGWQTRRAEPLLLADGGGWRGFPAARLESDRREAEAGHARAARNAGRRRIRRPRDPR